MTAIARPADRPRGTGRVRSAERLGIISAFAVMIAACTSSSPAQSGQREAATPSAVMPSRVVIAIGAEVNNLVTKFENGNTYASEFHFMTNSPLVLRDAQGQPHPLLAAELPSRDNATWVVNPDGTMRTTWKIKPNAKWQDGQPVTSADFVFALKVYMDDGLPVRDRIPEQFMERIEPLDDHSFLIHWNKPYPWAGELVARQLEPLPLHLVGSLYDAGDPDAFINNAFWSGTDYIGEGPFRLVTWTPGTQLEYRAFGEYFMGRPPLDEVVFRVIPDTNTVVANVLGGDVDATVGITLGQQAGKTVQEQWSQTGEGRVVTTPVRWRYTQIQFDSRYSQQPALDDLRVRRALIHGIDRDTLANVVTDGTSGAAEVLMSPGDPRYGAVQAAIAHYPYDGRRALSLLQEAGWTQRGDALVDAAGQPFALDIRTTQQTDNQTELTVMAADLVRLGLQVTQSIVPQSRIRDSQYRISFPGLNNTARSIDVPGTMEVAITAQCPDPERRYTGGNRGCWSNPDYDRLYLVASTSLDPQERESAVVQALKILTEDVGVIGLSYNSESLAVRGGLVGPGPRWPAQVGNTWNIHEWRWEAGR